MFDGAGNKIEVKKSVAGSRAAMSYLCMLWVTLLLTQGHHDGEGQEKVHQGH